MSLASPDQTGEQALKLTVYFGERARVRGSLLADELLTLHEQQAIRVSVLLRGVQGFGARHARRSDRLLTLSEDLPLLAVAVDAPERVLALADSVRALAPDCELTLERARLIPSSDLSVAPAPDQAEVKLTVYLGRHERVARTPAFVVACETLRAHGVAGATVLLGVDGTIHGQRRRARFFGRNVGVPMAIVSVGPAGSVFAALSDLRDLPDSLLTLERVQVCKRDGVVLQAPSDSLTARTAESRQKLTVVTSEASHHEGRSVYLELVRRLRAAGAAGATSLRGIWGFHGEHAPHGDRLLSLRRHVPVVTVTIDTPQRIDALWPIVDELTHERGLVTSELLPEAHRPMPLHYS